MLASQVSWHLGHLSQSVPPLVCRTTFPHQDAYRADLQ